jgi:hypothetical protein
LAAAGWRGIRDALDGLFLRATGACRVGDYVQLEGVDGRVRELGFRFMTLETSEGHIATVPYGRAARSSLRRLPEVKHGLLHVFRLAQPTNLPLPVSKRAVLRAALLCPWCVPKRNARIRTLDQGKALEITIALVDADHAAEAEEVIREAVSRLTESSVGAARREPGAGDPATSTGSSHPPSTHERPSLRPPGPALGRVSLRRP